MAALAFPLAKPTRSDQVVRTIPLPNGATRQRHFDLLGRLLCDEEPDGNQLHYQYEDRFHNGGSLHSIQQQAGAAIRYVMDRDQHQLRACLGPVETTIQFGPNGSPEQSSTSIDGHSWNVCYRWDEEGRITAILISQAATWLHIDYQEDDSVTLSSGEHEYCRAWRDQATRQTILDFANGAWTREDLAVGAQLRVSQVTTGTANEDVAVTTKFAYATDGRISRVDDRYAQYDP